MFEFTYIRNTSSVIFLTDCTCEYMSALHDTHAVTPKSKSIGGFCIGNWNDVKSSFPINAVKRNSSSASPTDTKSVTFTHTSNTFTEFVGDDVGDDVGDKVGAVGEIVGDTVGAVGVFVGETLGFNEGVTVGDNDGDVGVNVGDNDGIVDKGVGDIVGSKLHVSLPNDV